MQTGISKTLEGMIARAAFDTAKAGIERSLKDYLMLEILKTEGSIACQIAASQLDRERIDDIAAQIASRLESDSDNAPTQRPEEFFGNYVRELITLYSDSGTVSSIHAMFDILQDDNTVSSQVFTTYEKVRLALARDRYNESHLHSADIYIRTADIADNTAPTSQSMLSKFGTDLTARAREGKIDPVVGREHEIERVIQILSRRKKNNPVLIGEAGVGKSAIVEGLALRMAAGDVPATISGKRLFSLDISSLVAGTKFRGEFEERMQQLLDELRRNDDTIIFIDEIHTIVGAGSTQGSLDTANILKPALARGELQTIGATTLDEYRENIERDAALERRFQKVTVEPASCEETLQILRNIAPNYERHHNVRYTDAALQACVTLAERYISDRYFPDKAIDILDEAGSRARSGSLREPESLREMESSLAAVERERREAVAAMTYEKAAAARVRELALRTRIDESRAEWRRSQEMNPVTVDADCIASVITAMTGIPAERIAGGELERVRTLQERLSARIIGQNEAVASVAKAIRRSRSGLRDSRRPVGVFLFVGPTGVGKTLLAKELSELLFDGRRGLIRLDMSEYGEKHNVSRLIGSPPGYVGYGEGGQLTEAVRRRPYSVVLFDEIEKAHPDVFNTMLQIFDEGRLTDGSGRVVDFRNTVIVMTSNAGSRNVQSRPPQVGYLTSSHQSAAGLSESEEYRKALEQTFAPEFLNRVDDVIVFRTLEQEDVERIVDLELSDVRERASKLGFGLRVTDDARRELADRGYEARYGVRALRRTLAEDVEEPLATLIIEGKLHDGDTVVVEKSELGGVTLFVA
ncbi:MAG: ATP-dependent Clp protease ATP-binding subunit [Alistipes sp.]|nr:ATP-dependent Clp protease ATP-binding subunit [Alistipes sp.]